MLSPPWARFRSLPTISQFQLNWLISKNCGVVFGMVGETFRHTIASFLVWSRIGSDRSAQRSCTVTAVYGPESSRAQARKISRSVRNENFEFDLILIERKCLIEKVLSGFPDAYYCLILPFVKGFIVICPYLYISDFNFYLSISDSPSTGPCLAVWKPSIRPVHR